MLSWIRETFGTVIIGGIITFIAFVFVFYGVFSPKSTRGLHEGAVAGTVNGDSISISDFNTALNRKLEYFKAYSGGKISEEQLKSYRVREGVFQELANRKLLLQEAETKGLLPAEEEIRDKIREIPAFKKDGKFDVATYKKILELNNHSPGSFERLVRDDLAVQQWETYFRNGVHVSREEVKTEYTVSQEKRTLKYVLLTSDAVKKTLQVSPDEIKTSLADPGKMNLARLKFEEGQKTTYKDQKFESAQNEIAKNILVGQKLEEVQKINQDLATQILALMTQDPALDAKVNALLKKYSLQVKTTGLLTRQSNYIPGVGEAKDLMTDAFAAKSPIDPKLGGKAKKYSLAGKTLVALVTGSQQADLTHLEKERDSLIEKIASRKSQAVYQDWMQKIIAKAKIDTNAAVVGSGS